MSKIKVDEIESSSANVKLASKGTGLVKVKGANNDDGTLKLSSSTHGVKIKSPAHSAGQSYTLTLPDNNIEADKFLKITSVSNDVGQLQYATIAAPDLTNLAANNITSGTLNAARFPSSFPATQAGLKFLSKHAVGATAVSDITITGFEADKMYLLIGKNITMSGSTYIRYTPLDASGNNVGSCQTEVNYANGSNDAFNTTSSGNFWYDFGYHQNAKRGFIAEINNTTDYGGMLLRGMNPQQYDAKHQLYATFTSAGKRIHSFKIDPNSSTTFQQNTQFLLYEYLES
tara:strand:+ start:2611 stop:3471 length:861 start_codon:yes stop_codon:yes gene_type:complete